MMQHDATAFLVRTPHLRHPARSPKFFGYSSAPMTEQISNPEVSGPAAAQLAEISRGTHEVLTRPELVRKLSRGRPLLSYTCRKRPPSFSLPRFLRNFSLGSKMVTMLKISERTNSTGPGPSLSRRGRWRCGTPFDS